MESWKHQVYPRKRILLKLSSNVLIYISCRTPPNSIQHHKQHALAASSFHSYILSTSLFYILQPCCLDTFSRATIHFYSISAYNMKSQAVPLALSSLALPLVALAAPRGCANHSASNSVLYILTNEGANPVAAVPSTLTVPSTRPVQPSPRLVVPAP